MVLARPRSAPVGRRVAGRAGPARPARRRQARYFSDVVVPAASPARRIADLAGARWAYNDTCSLSGWFAVRARVGDPASFFGNVLHSGSHLASLELVATGLADGAAIDSTVLGWALPARPDLARAVRVVESCGPYPIQPVVARADLEPVVATAVVEALAGFGPAARELAPFGLAGFVRGAPELDVAFPGASSAAHP